MKHAVAFRALALGAALIGLSGCGDPLSGVDRLSDLELAEDPPAAVAAAPTSPNEPVARPGLFSRMLRGGGPATHALGRVVGVQRLVNEVACSDGAVPIGMHIVKCMHVGMYAERLVNEVTSSDGAILIGMHVVELPLMYRLLTYMHMYVHMYVLYHSVVVPEFAVAYSDGNLW